MGSAGRPAFLFSFAGFSPQGAPAGHRPVESVTSGLMHGCESSISCWVPSPEVSLGIPVGRISMLQAWAVLGELALQPAYIILQYSLVDLQLLDPHRCLKDQFVQVFLLTQDKR